MSGTGSESWRIVVCTDFPGMAQAYLQIFAAYGHRLVGVVTTPKRSPDYLDVARGLPPDIDVLISGHPRRWAAMLAPLRPDLLVSSVFPHRIPEDALALPRLGAYNVHPALLPRYRGTGTPMWHFRNGERETGLTLHRMLSDFDTGPILAQVRCTIEDDDDWAALAGKYQGLFAPLWAQALPRIAAGDPGEPQDERQASYFGAFPDDERWWGIDWSRGAREIHNQVRSCALFLREPGAVGTIDGRPYRIHHTRIISEGVAPQAPAGSFVAPGASERPRVQCGDGVLELVRYEPIDRLTTA